MYEEKRLREETKLKVKDKKSKLRNNRFAVMTFLESKS